MPLIFDNTIIEKLIFNQTEVDKAIFNGETIFEKIRKIVYTPELVSKIISPFGETVNLTVESPQGGGEYDTANITSEGSVPISNLSFNKNTNVLSFNTSTCDKGAKTTVKLPVINCVNCFDYILDVDINGCTHPNMTKYAAKSPTCTASGNYAYYKCSCSNNTLNSDGNLYDPNRSSLGHSFTSKNTSSTYLKSSTNCTSAAVFYYSCSRCGAKGTSTFTSGSALGHSFTQDEIWSESRQLRTAATCTAAATYWRKCDRCTTLSTSKYFSSGSALGHNMVNETCSRCGYTTHTHSYDSNCTCSCGATNHNWEKINSLWTCTKCGYTLDDSWD